MAEKPTEQDLVRLAVEAQKLLREFIELPFTEPERATQLLLKFDRKVAEFKRLQSKLTSRPVNARISLMAEAAALRRCSTCRQRIVLRKRDHVETEGAVYHRACYNR